MGFALLVTVNVLAWVLLALGGWLVFQLLRQNARILMRLEALEASGSAAAMQPGLRPAPPPGLALGTAAPAFELRSLTGRQHRLSEWRGRRLLLIFFDPRCGFCSRMVPELAELPVDPKSGRPLPLLLTTGSAGENRELLADLRCPVLMQESGELAARYGAAGTPMGYLLDEEGRIASELAVGADALLALAGPPLNGTNGRAQTETRKPGNRPLAESRLNRDGLKAGTPAPPFRVPRLNGGELSLDEYRGQPVLLVFSDPHCGPCEALAPRLQQAAGEGGAVRVLMVSRGDPEANRLKAAELGLTFPIGLQRQWEVSKQYAMFATPIAYLIDEAGVIASDVAVGLEPILALLEGSPRPEARQGVLAAT